MLRVSVLAEDDRRRRQALLSLIVRSHPVQWSTDELIRELAGEEGGFAEQDAVRVAIRDLTGSGVLHRHGQFVFATRAATTAYGLAV